MPQFECERSRGTPERVEFLSTPFAILQSIGEASDEGRSARGGLEHKTRERTAAGRQVVSAFMARNPEDLRFTMIALAPA